FHGAVSTVIAGSAPLQWRSSSGFSHPMSGTGVPRSQLRLRRGRGLLGAPEAEQGAGDAADLDLLAALGDAVAAVMAVDVLERRVARIADAAMDLDRPVRRLADQPVGAVIRHRHPFADVHVVLAVEVPGGL